ncbi:hypothetical protein EDD15DRAFT_2199593 [Pisolithus albus]|nr:hypothetical protein EDD15DRAFT_2199593 [Pisolithus albus]
MPGTVVLSRDAHVVEKIIIENTTYTSNRKVHRDSLIQFYRIPGEDSQSGQIEEIFLHTRAGPNGDPLTEYFLVVQPFNPLSPAQAKHDPYLKFPLLDVRLHHKELLVGLVIRAANVIGHVACCPYKAGLPEGNMQVVLALSRGISAFL